MRQTSEADPSFGRAVSALRGLMVEFVHPAPIVVVGNAGALRGAVGDPTVVAAKGNAHSMDASLVRLRVHEAHNVHGRGAISRMTSVL